MVVPPFKKHQAQFSPTEVATTKVIANLRIIVENCIMRTRYFRILRRGILVSVVQSAIPSLGQSLLTFGQEFHMYT